MERDKKISKASFITKAYAVLAPEFQNVEEVIEVDADIHSQTTETNLNNKYE